MVVRLENTERSFSSSGHDWMFRMSGNETIKPLKIPSFESNNYLFMWKRTPSLPVISLTEWKTSSFFASSGGMLLKSSLWKTETWTCRLHQAFHRFCYWCQELPEDSCDQEVKAALDLGTVDEAVDVAGVHRLPVLCTCTLTNYRGNKSQVRNDPEEGNAVSLLPFGQNPLHGSHCFWPSRSTSILSGGQTLTQELPSTTKWAKGRENRSNTCW